MANGQRIAVVGATGAVGQTVLKILEDRNFPVRDIRLLASARSVGKKMTFKGEQLPVEEVTADSFKGIDFAFFSAGGDQSKKFAQHVVKAGAIMIDKSSAFRMWLPEKIRHQGLHPATREESRRVVLGHDGRRRDDGVSPCSEKV